LLGSHGQATPKRNVVDKLRLEHCDANVVVVIDLLQFGSQVIVTARC
jgi:hypothetical protein